VRDRYLEPGHRTGRHDAYLYGKLRDQPIASERPGLLTILAPRHPERGAEIAERTRRRGVAVALRSAERVPPAEANVFIMDSIGELGLVFRLVCSRIRPMVTKIRRKAPPFRAGDLRRDVFCQHVEESAVNIWYNRPVLSRTAL
jgi:hypothetical protein